MRPGAAGRPSCRAASTTVQYGFTPYRVSATFRRNAARKPLSGTRSPPVHTGTILASKIRYVSSLAWFTDHLIDTVHIVSMRQGNNNIEVPRREDQLVHLIGCTAVLDLLDRIGHERGHADDRRREHNAGDKDDHV